MEIDYSVIIRTTGKAGEKYNELLKSIKRLEPQPKEVIVVLPNGYKKPEEQIGTETFCFCPKGMVRQRMEGINICETEYALICDDDVSFDKDFVKKLYKPIRSHHYSFSIGPLYSFLPKKGKQFFICLITGSAMPSIFHRNRYISVLKGTGYSYNKHLKSDHYAETQSAAWTCFFANIADLRRLHFDEEFWLDMNGYSALDDQTMFYKAWLMGMKTVVVPDALYKHLDAKTSKRNNSIAFCYTLTFNRVVFWHRFIYKIEKGLFGKLAAVICFNYRMFWISVLELILYKRRRITKEELMMIRKGYAEGKRFIKNSKAYKDLPAIKKNNSRKGMHFYNSANNNI